MERRRLYQENVMLHNAILFHPLPIKKHYLCRNNNPTPMIQLIVFWFAGVILFFTFLMLLMRLVRKIDEKRKDKARTTKENPPQENADTSEE